MPKTSSPRYSTRVGLALRRGVVAQVAASSSSPGRQMWSASAVSGGCCTARDDRVGERAAVEAVRAAPGDPPVGPCQVGVALDACRRRGRCRRGRGRARSEERMSSKYAALSCVCSLKVRSITKPSRATRIAAPQRAPQRPRAVAAQRAAPSRRRCRARRREAAVARVVERAAASPFSKNESGRIAAGDFSRESIVVTLPFGLRISMKPPPPIPAENGSVTPSTAAAATAASTALPPRAQHADRRAGRDAVDGRGRAAGPARGRPACTCWYGAAAAATGTASTKMAGEQPEQRAPRHWNPSRRLPARRSYPAVRDGHAEDVGGARRRRGARAAA